MRLQLAREQDQEVLLRLEEGDAALEVAQEGAITSLVGRGRIQAVQVAQSGVEPVEIPIDPGLRRRAEIGLLPAVEVAADVVRLAPELGPGQALAAIAAAAACREQDGPGAREEENRPPHRYRGSTGPRPGRRRGKSGCPDSNWGPLRPERSALPGCATPRNRPIG